MYACYLIGDNNRLWYCFVNGLGSALPRNHLDLNTNPSFLPLLNFTTDYSFCFGADQDGFEHKVSDNLLFDGSASMCYHLIVNPE